MTKLDFVKFLFKTTKEKKITWKINKENLDFIETAFFITDKSGSKVTYKVSYQSSENVIIISSNSRIGEFGQLRVIRLDDDEETNKILLSLIDLIVVYAPDSDEEFLDTVYTMFDEVINKNENDINCGLIN